MQDFGCQTSEELSDASIRKALDRVEKSDQVLVTDFPIGSSNRRIREVLEEARRQEKLVKMK